MDGSTGPRLRIAVVGAGISGLSAAWLLSKSHSVTLFEQSLHAGGHSLTVDVQLGGRSVPVDMGFIVYNTKTYPNLTALLGHLGVATQASEMSFGVSLEDGSFEYSGRSLSGLLAQPGNLVRPRLWSMVAEIFRFYREAPGHLEALEKSGQTLGQYLDDHRYGAAFRRDHLLPMAAAIWSSPAGAMLEYPAATFIRFFENHDLLNLSGRPIWRTVTGGSRQYVDGLSAMIPGVLQPSCTITAIHREGSGVSVITRSGEAQRFDRVVIATHANQALALLADPSAAERELLGAFRYTRNHAILHTDKTLMPRSKRAWSSWNVLGGGARSEAQTCVSYWMNRLQSLPTTEDVFVTLNPAHEPRPDLVLRSEIFSHPLFDTAAITAQRTLWSLQGRQNTWYCGAYFGSGFHEDGLQAGLAVAEQLGGVRRPWSVAGESGRIHLNPTLVPPFLREPHTQ